MNPRTQEFEALPIDLPADDERRQWVQFRVGERITIKGLEFEVRKVWKRDLALKLIPNGQGAK